MVVMDIWNIDARQKQKYLTGAELCHFMSVSITSYHLLISITLLSQNGITKIFTIKFEMNNITFAIKDSCEDHFDWHMNEIAPSDYAMDIRIFHSLCL